MASGLYPNEDVGMNGHSLTSLPGCNKLWSDNSTKPTCDDDDQVSPTIDLQLGPNLESYNYVSCPFGFTSTGAMLTDFTLRNAKGLDQCLEVCSNYTYIGVTQQPEGNLGWVTECWCGDQLKNNYTLISDPSYACQQRCPGKYSELCGGYGSWQLYEKCSGNACHQNSAFPSSVPIAIQSSTTTKAPTSAFSTSTLQSTFTSLPSTQSVVISSSSTSDSEILSSVSAPTPISSLSSASPSTAPATTSQAVTTTDPDSSTTTRFAVSTITKTRTFTRDTTTKTVTRTRTFYA